MKSKVLTLLKLSQTCERQMVIETKKVSAFPPLPNINDYFPPAFRSQAQPKSASFCRPETQQVETSPSRPPVSQAPSTRPREVTLSACS